MMFPLSRWSFLIGDEPCTVINKAIQAQSPVVEEIVEEEEEEQKEEEEEEAREPTPVNEQIVEVVVEDATDKEEEQEKSEIEPTKVSVYHLCQSIDYINPYVSKKFQP